MRSGWGVVDLVVDAPGPCPLRIAVHDGSGHRVHHHRLSAARVRLTLRPGRHVVTVDDDRLLHDPHRHTTARVVVDVVEGHVTTARAVLAQGSVVRLAVRSDDAPARFARVDLRHTDGELVTLRADGGGRVVAAGLRVGAWTLEATDSRRARAAASVVLDVAPGLDRCLGVDLEHVTSRLLVRMRGADDRPVAADHVVLVHAATGRRTTTPVSDGLADVRGLVPGRHRLEVPASVGHLGTTIDVGELAPAALASCVATVPAGAVVTGRVVQGTSRYCAVVVLLDAEGRELDRTRTDGQGRYALGRGLTSTLGLTVEATSGPETVHVTRAAVADVDVVTGVRHDLGDLVLPGAGRRAHWTPRTRDCGAMRLPSTRV